MSYDRKLDQVCPHMVVEEPLFVFDDRQTITPLRPISSVRSVRVRLNGELEIPPSGLRSAAQAVGTKPGPFGIQSGVNDRLLLSVDGGPVQTLQAPVGKVPVVELVRALNKAASGVIFEVTKKRQVRVRSATKGPGSTIELKTGSTLAPVVGLAQTRVWRGATVAPGWSVVSAPNTLQDRPLRLVIFDAPLKATQNYVEIDYTTVRQECRRCGGLGVEYDWRYTRRGDVIEVRDEALLIQEVMKVVFTVRGSNRHHQGYGTQIVNMIGQKQSANGLARNFIVSDIYEAFNRWQQIKKQQEEVVGQVVSDEEFPFRLVSVTLDPNDEDPTLVFVHIVVQNRSGKPISIERGIRVPGPEDLLGAASQGAFRQSLNNFALIG